MIPGGFMHPTRVRPSLAVVAMLAILALVASLPDAARAECPFATKSGCASAQAAPGACDANKQIVTDYFRCISDPGFKEWDKYFPERVTLNGTSMSQEGLRETLASFRAGFSDLVFLPMGQMAEGDRVATWGFFEGTHTGDFLGVPSTGKRARWFGTAVDRIENGKVVEMWHQMDLLSVMQQIRPAGNS